MRPQSASTDHMSAEDSHPGREAFLPPGEPLLRLNHATLQEQVYQQVREAIRAGRFASGETVTIRGLASMLGTSAMPVREAMRRLVQENVLEVLPNNRTRVLALSPQRFAELIDIRVVLEGHAAFLAAQHSTEADFIAIKTANEELGRAADARDALAANAANERFHFAVYRAGGSSMLLSVIDGLWQQTGPYLAHLVRNMVATGELATVGMVHHFELLAALGARDAEAARRAIATDIGHSARWFTENGSLKP